MEVEEIESGGKWSLKEKVSEGNSEWMYRVRVDREGGVK